MAFSLKKLSEKEVVFESGLQGKKIVLYSTNNCGKSYQASKFPKPFFIATESGQSALNCLKEPCDSWRKFKEIVKDLTDDKTYDENYKLVNTVIIDTFDLLVDQSEKSICLQYGVNDLSEITGRVNGYKLARSEMKILVNKLTSKNYCVVFIMHESLIDIEDELTGEVSKFIQPLGTENVKSSARMIRDMCDFAIYLKPQGVDPETFEVIPSMAICNRTKNVFARSRFKMPTIINPFTADSLIKAIEDSVNSGADEQGARVEQYIEKQKEYTKEDYFEIIKPYFSKLNSICSQDVLEIVETNLGVGKKISNATDDEIFALENIYNLLVTKAITLGVEV